ncbi:MAG: hypothetical protein IPH78_01945 [Bacteroidetes bacterium]|nr:hypothetical protein [Bacteroidota bacterium]
MKTNPLIKAIETKNFSDFEKAWTKLHNRLTETDKQHLLTEIIDYHYTDKEFHFYVNVFDKIIDSKVSLDFNIDLPAPTLLSLVVLKGSRKLFDYFLRKGANLNFIGDTYAFMPEESTQPDIEEPDTERYSTCLDFAEHRLADDLVVNYRSLVIDIKEYITNWQGIDDKEEITVKKRDYYCLLEQSEYLRDLIRYGRLVEHIKSLGGKTYSQLTGK